MSRLTDLIREAKRLDPTLGEALDAEVRHLTERRAFGLNFERHAPEVVDLHGRPVRRGDKVRMLPPRGETQAQDNRLWRATGARETPNGRLIHLQDLRSDGVAEHPVDDLVVVAESTDVIYPGLVSTGRIERGGDTPFHTVINSENLHALKALLYTHRGKVDCIYIDPPYNTGNDDWIYSDKYVANDDLYRHSKWLSFMERRLEIAKELLADTGVIIVAIGDDEHHRLRMLMDQVLGADNFISDVVWQGGRKNDSRFVSNGADYMLVYGKRLEVKVELGHRWRERKQGIDAALEYSQEIHASGISHPEAEKAWRVWIRWAKKELGITDAVARYNSLDPETGEPIFTGGDVSWPGGGGPRYDVIHPETGVPVKVPSRGWIYADPQDLHAAIKEGRFRFGPDHTFTLQAVRRLSSLDSQVAESVFREDRRAESQRVKRMLGEVRFPNPKSTAVLARWLTLVTSTQSVILDFFGGSGSTLEAVERMNAHDGGTRQCMLVTNNEVGAKEAKALVKQGRRKGDPEWEAKGVHNWVTKPRIVAVTTGERPDGSRFDDTVDANVEFFDLSYEAPLKVSTHHDFERIAPLLWLRAGATGRRIDALPDGWDVADTYGVIDRLQHTERFAAALADAPNARIAFVVTDDERRFQTVVSQLPAGVEPVRLYESYLRNFEIDAARSAR